MLCLAYAFWVTNSVLVEFLRFMTQPLDVVKLRMQLIKLKKRTNLISTILKILREEGGTAFFQGHTLGQVLSSM